MKTHWVVRNEGLTIDHLLDEFQSFLQILHYWVVFYLFRHGLFPCDLCLRIVKNAAAAVVKISFLGLLKLIMRLLCLDCIISQSIFYLLQVFGVDICVFQSCFNIMIMPIIVSVLQRLSLAATFFHINYFILKIKIYFQK